MIKIENLTKTYRGKVVVDNLTFNIDSGVITGFLGSNGAGKSTTMKMIIGLVEKSDGRVEVLGGEYKNIKEPLKEVGVFIDSSAINVEYTAQQHLDIYATALKLPKERIDDILVNVGLNDVGNKKVKEFSLGMKQRLGIATALIGNPKILILDEPFNGLDVDGIQWLRGLLKKLAQEGKSIFLSSHLMSEMQEIVDKIVVISDGKLLANMTIEEMREKSLDSYVKICCGDVHKMYEILKELGKNINVDNEEKVCNIYNMTQKEVGQIAFENNIPVYELTKVQPKLEQLFVNLTR